jgi:hypothetical protein
VTWGQESVIIIAGAVAFWWGSSVLDALKRIATQLEKVGSHLSQAEFQQQHAAEKLDAIEQHTRTAVRATYQLDDWEDLDSMA